MFTRILAPLLALTLSCPVFAAITPTSPDSNTVVKVGDDIKALWTADTTGSWNNVEIQLMTGDNLQMIPLATLATGIDGTTTTSFSIAAPDVSPYSKIYFLQFTLGGDVSTSTWTTRFTIAAADGSVTDPTNSTVYGGQSVQWGTGSLIGAVTSGNTTSSSSASAVPVSASVSPTVISSSIAVSDVASSSALASSGTSASASATSTRATSTSAAPATSSGAAVPKASIGLGAAVLALIAAMAL